MTERIGSMATEGKLTSATDVARMQAEDDLHLEWQRKAVRVVAASAADAADCRMLLALLGLTDDIVVSARRSASGSAQCKPVRKRRAHAA